LPRGKGEREVVIIYTKPEWPAGSSKGHKNIGKRAAKHHSASEASCFLDNADTTYSTKPKKLPLKYPGMVYALRQVRLITL
jgi:hypothetical protein